MFRAFTIIFDQLHIAHRARSLRPPIDACIRQRSSILCSTVHYSTCCGTYYHRSARSTFRSSSRPHSARISLQKNKDIVSTKLLLVARKQSTFFVASLLRTYCGGYRPKHPCLELSSEPSHRRPPHKQSAAVVSTSSSRSVTQVSDGSV